MDPEAFPSRRQFVRRRSWPEFLARVAAAQEDNYLGENNIKDEEKQEETKTMKKDHQVHVLLSSGLLRPLHQGCDPCTFHYDVPVMMETFDRDIR